MKFESGVVVGGRGGVRAATLLKPLAGVKFMPSAMASQTTERRITIDFNLQLSQMSSLRYDEPVGPILIERRLFEVASQLRS